MKDSKLIILFITIFLLLPVTFLNASSELVPYNGYLFEDYDNLPALQLLPEPNRTLQAYALLKAVVTGSDQVIPFLPMYLQQAIKENPMKTAGNYSGANTCLLYAKFEDVQNIELILLWDIINVAKEMNKSRKFAKSRFLNELRGGFTEYDEGTGKISLVTKIDSNFPNRFGAFYEHELFLKVDPEVPSRDAKYIYPITRALLAGLYNKDPRVRLLCLAILEQVGEHFYMQDDLKMAMEIETVGADVDRIRNEDRVLPPWRYITRPMKYNEVYYPDANDSQNPLPLDSPYMEMYRIKYYEIIDIDATMHTIRCPYLELDEFFRRIVRILIAYKVENGELKPEDFAKMDMYLWKVLTQPIEFYHPTANNADIDESNPNNPEFFNVPMRLWLNGFSAFIYLKYDALVPLGFPADSGLDLEFIRNITDLNKKLEEGTVALHDAINQSPPIVVPAGVSMNIGVGNMPICKAMAGNLTVTRKHNQIIKLLLGSLANNSWTIRYSAAENLIRIFQSSTVNEKNRVLILKAIMYGSQNPDFAALYQVYSGDVSRFSQYIQQTSNSSISSQITVKINKSIYDIAYQNYKNGLGSNIQLQSPNSSSGNNYLQDPENVGRGGM